MPTKTLVVVVRHEAAAPAAEGNSAIFVVEIGLVLIDQIPSTQEPLALPFLGLVALLGPRFARWRMRGEVEIAIGGVIAVVGNARVVALLGRRPCWFPTSCSCPRRAR